MQWSLELRGSNRLEYIDGNPVVGRGDPKSFVGSLEWYGPQATRRIRFLLNYDYSCGSKP
jgi:hypothetical protein